MFSRSIVTIKLVKTEQSHANFRSRFFSDLAALHFL